MYEVYTQEIQVEVCILSIRTHIHACLPTAAKSEVHITWDEPTIAEHDKLRGTRQKIDEPSTPYHYGSGESSTGSDCESAGTQRMH